VLWFWLLIMVFGDVFRRHDISGWGKFAWSLFVIVIPLLGVLVYLIAQGKQMGQRNIDQATAQKAELDAYVRETAGAGGPGSEIANAKQLLDSGTITPEEFEQIKRKALA
jgi:Short C-terminal domain/Phospholipase_D-nuclease N-terminal